MRWSGTRPTKACLRAVGKSCIGASLRHYQEKFADAVEAEPELLAHHFTRAGLTEPAIEYWGKAGDFALRRSAFGKRSRISARR